MFKKLFTENREQTKKDYLTKSYDEKSIKELDKRKKNGSVVYIQYKDKRSRSGISGGDVLGFDSKGVIVKSRFNPDEKITIPYDDIKYADIIKGGK